MEPNTKSQIKIILIVMAFGLGFAVIVGAIAGTFNLSAGIFVPIIVLPITFVTYLFIKNRQPK